MHGIAFGYKHTFLLYIYTSLFTQSVATTKMISKNKDALSVSGALVARRLK